MEPPCKSSPEYFLQPGEDAAWHLEPAAHWAMQQCETACPRPLADCARDALSAGTLLGADPATHPRVASGVIQAGIVCRGDAATYQALLDIAYPDGGQPTSLTVACPACARPFYTGDEETDAAADDPVHRASLNSPFCRSCYSDARRKGNLQPIRLVVPSHCVDCGDPMTSRTNPKPGHVRHEAGGRCAVCCRRARRTGAAAA